MNLKDIIALAKAGYSVSDVKELISMTSSDDPEPAAQEEKPKDEKTEEPETGKDTASEAPEKSTEDPAKVIAIDEYKKQIDEYKKQIDDLKKQVKDLQEKNTHKDVSGNKDDKSDEDVINDITRSFM